jgi:hypothetical protein
MIAIVILGLGLLIVASMFPIAWMRARDHVEFSEVRVATDSAETLVKLKARVARFNPEVGANCTVVGGMGPLCFDATSFLGDIGVYPLYDERLDGSDRRVHPINMYNMLVDASGYDGARTSVQPFNAPLFDLSNEVFVQENTWRLERGYDLEANYPPPAVLFEDRLLPPLPVKLNPDLSINQNDLADPQMNAILGEWYAQLRTRRFGWAVLARMNNGDGNWIDPAAAHVGEKEAADITYTIYNESGQRVPHSEAFDDPRVFTTYYVTLRRTQATFRFPQQDGDSSVRPPIPPNGNAVEVRALGAEFDTVLPTPWRVQIWVPSPSATVTGVPSDVEANPPSPSSASTSVIVTQFLPRGAYMIDEENGQVYQVARQKLTNNDQSAILTLDKEITVADISPIGGPYVKDRDNLRTVWVFPPPVEADRGPNGALIIAGTQPVVGIEIRPLVMTP